MLHKIIFVVAFIATLWCFCKDSLKAMCKKSPTNIFLISLAALIVILMLYKNSKISSSLNPDSYIECGKKKKQENNKEKGNSCVFNNEIVCDDMKIIKDGMNFVRGKISRDPELVANIKFVKNFIKELTQEHKSLWEINKDSEYFFEKLLWDPNQDKGDGQFFETFMPIQTKKLASSVNMKRQETTTKIDKSVARINSIRTLKFVAGMQFVGLSSWVLIYQELRGFSFYEKYFAELFIALIHLLTFFHIQCAYVINWFREDKLEYLTNHISRFVKDLFPDATISEQDILFELNKIIDMNNTNVTAENIAIKIQEQFQKIIDDKKLKEQADKLAIIECQRLVRLIEDLEENINDEPEYEREIRAQIRGHIRYINHMTTEIPALIDYLPNNWNLNEVVPIETLSAYSSSSGDVFPSVIEDLEEMINNDPSLLDVPIGHLHDEDSSEEMEEMEDWRPDLDHTVVDVAGSESNDDPSKFVKFHKEVLRRFDLAFQRFQKLIHNHHDEPTVQYLIFKASCERYIRQKNDKEVHAKGIWQIPEAVVSMIWCQCKIVDIANEWWVYRNSLPVLGPYVVLFSSVEIFWDNPDVYVFWKYIFACLTIFATYSTNLKINVFKEWLILMILNYSFDPINYISENERANVDYYRPTTAFTATIDLILRSFTIVGVWTNSQISGEQMIAANIGNFNSYFNVFLGVDYLKNRYQFNLLNKSLRANGVAAGMVIKKDVVDGLDFDLD